MMSRIQFSADLANDAAEQKMFQAGIERYQKRLDRLTKAGAAGERDDYAQLVKRSLLGVAERLDHLVEVNETRKNPNKVLLKVKTIPSVTVAYLGLTTLFTTLTKENDKTKVANRIGSSLEDEARFSFIASQNPKLWERLQRFAEERSNYRNKRNFVLNVAAKEGVDAPEWDTATTSLVGIVVLTLIEEAGLVRIVNETENDRTTSTVELTETTTNWLEDYRRRGEAGGLPLTTPVFAPMTETPVDWEKPYGGGYRHIRLQLVKQGRASYRDADMSRVYRAVNTMQRTAWRINRAMLELVNLLWSVGDEVGKLPRGAKVDIPDRLDEATWGAMAPEERKGHRLALREAHATNRQASSDLVGVNQVLDQARDLKDASALYIPYQLDYRGRVYAVPLLNPQGPDYIRSLFEFSVGKPVGERGGMWLAIQAASLWDGDFNGRKLSKCSFQERYEWTEANEEMLRRVVEDPFTNTEWMSADKPFMFIRTAMEWVGFLDTGPDFVSALPIALDGSCSGIQHYSALLRDPVGGASVNLLPAELPADVYNDVAQAVLAEVEAENDPKNAEARAFWLHHGINRKVVKKPVMTYGYSSREAGFTDWYESQFVRPAFKKAGLQTADQPSRPLPRQEDLGGGGEGPGGHGSGHGVDDRAGEADGPRGQGHRVDSTFGLPGGSALREVLVREGRDDAPGRAHPRRHSGEREDHQQGEAEVRNFAEPHAQPRRCAPRPDGPARP
jgi:DNA-directed RNA polymerase